MNTFGPGNPWPVSPTGPGGPAGPRSPWRQDNKDTALTSRTFLSDCIKLHLAVLLASCYLLPCANYIKRQFDDLFIFIYLWAGYGPSWLPWHAQLAWYSTFTLQSVELARDLKSNWCSSLFWQHLCCQTHAGDLFYGFIQRLGWCGINLQQQVFIIEY